MNRLKGFSALLLAGLLYAVNDILIRVISTQLTTYQQLTFRALVGVIIISIIVFITKPTLTRKKISKTYLFLYSLSFPVTVILFTMGIMHSKVASVVFAFYAGSFLFSFLSEILIFKEALNRYKVTSLLLVLGGLLFFTYPFSLQDISIGFLFGLAAGGLMVFTNSLNKHIDGKIHYELLTLLQMIAGVIVGGIIMISLHQPFFPHITNPMIGIIILSGFFLMSVVFLAAYGFKHFDLHLGTIVTSSELFFAPAFAVFIFQESLSASEFIGGLLITLAIIIPQLQRVKKRIKE